MKGHMTPGPLDQMKVGAEMKGNERCVHRNQRPDQMSLAAFCFKGPVEAWRWRGGNGGEGLDVLTMSRVEVN